MAVPVAVSEHEIIGSVEAFTDKAVQVFRECSQVPTASRAHIFPTGGKGLEVEVTWTQRELERGKKVSFNKCYFVEKCPEPEGVHKLCASNFQADATNLVKVSYASDCCSRRVALVHDSKEDTSNKSSEPQQFIELWSESVLEKTVVVADLKDHHGKINEDIHFGSFQLSSDGRWLLYVAEKKKPKTVSFFAKPSKEEPTIRGAEHVYETNWGEQLSSVVSPVAVVMDLESEEVNVIDMSTLGDISAGQAVWVPGVESGVVFIGWDHLPQKLGFVYCLCRKSALYYANMKTGECSKLTDSDHTVFSPRFNPDGTRLVYFHCQAGGPHHSCSALKMMQWSDKTVATVVDVVKRPASPTSFPGLYSVFLPERCWDSSGTRLLLQDQWGSVQEVTLIDTNTGCVTNVSGPRKGAWVVLDVWSDLVVTQFSSLNSYPALFIGKFPEAGDAQPITWLQLSTSCHVTRHMTEGMTWEQLHFTSCEPPYEALLLLPPPLKTTPPALVVYPHGGPHVATSADFLVWPVCLAALGYAVLMVNYRGSMGFGQDSIYSLPGKVGSQDVQDVQNAVTMVIERGLADGRRVCVVGGSHGGFLTAHLIGQYPDYYRAAAIRNPVIDISGMLHTSDIPDWCYFECGLTYDPSMPPSSQDLATLMSKSPIIYVDKVLAPVLIHIGGCDLRCPPSQGLLYYNKLKAQGKETRLLLYPKDSHPISTVQSDADTFVNTAKWFFQNTPPIALGKIEEC